MTASDSARGGDPDLAALVARAKAGDDAALDRLCALCYDDVLSYFEQKIPAEAEDLTQELFASLPRKLEGYRESGRFRAWLRGVAFNMYLTRDRSRRRRPEIRLRTGADVAAAQTSSLFSTAKDDLRQLVTRLPLPLQQAWDMHAAGRSYKRIASELGISQGAAMTRVSRARTQLLRWMAASREPEQDAP